MSWAGFPRIALAIGLVIAAVLMAAGGVSQDAEPALPLLTMLILCEFGFVVTAIGAYVGARNLATQGLTARSGSELAGCVVLAAAFLVLGVALWPQGTPG